MLQFDDDFFKKEVRCDFEISAMMKRAWAAEMEVLCIIDEICRKNNLRYFAYSGTLLGAVRHKGFIPWDDDIDLAMLREDYTKLIQILPEQLPKGFVVTGIHAKEKKYRSDRTHQLMVAADRDLWDRNEYMRYFHGYPYKYVAVDIFPMDYVPEDEGLFRIQTGLIQKGLIIVAKWDELKEHGVLEKYITDYENQTGIQLPQEDTKFHLLKLTDTIASMYGKEDGENVTSIAWDHKEVVKDEKYLETIWMPFENIVVPAPIGYDEELRACYGDYKKFVRGTSIHQYPFYKEMDAAFQEELQLAGVPYSVEEFCEKILTNEIIVDWK